MSIPAPAAPLSPLADPLSLARLQVLLIPVHRPSAPGTSTGEQASKPAVLTEAVYEHWAKLFHNHQTLRGDEIVHGSGRGGTSTPSSPSPAARTHQRASVDGPRKRFLPSSAGASISRAASANHVHLAFPSQPPAQHLYALSLLRMAAFPLVVIGVAVDDNEEEAEGYSIDGQVEAGKRNSEAAAQLETAVWAKTFDDALAGILPPTSSFPLVKRLVLVPSQIALPGSPQRSPIRSTPLSPWVGAGAGVVRRAPLEGGDNWCAKLLGEVVGQVFGELGELATSLESPEGMKTLAGTLLPYLSTSLTSPQLTESPSQTPTNGQSRAGSPQRMVHSNSLPVVPSANMGHPSIRALTPGGRPTSVQAPSAPPIQTTAIAPAPSPTPASSNPFRRSGINMTSPFNRGSAAPSPSPTSTTSTSKDKSKDRDSGMARYTSAPLTGIAGGRLLKLLGDMYLLTGMYSDAIKCYDDGAERSRTVGDVLWEALAREGRAAAGIGEAWQGRDGSTNSTPFTSSPVPVEILSHYLSALACLCRAPIPFPPTIVAPTPERAGASSAAQHSAALSPHVGTGEGLLAYLYSSLCLRISHFVLLIFAAGGWGSIAISSLLAHTMPRSFPPMLEDRSDLSRVRQRRLALAHLASQSKLERTSILGHAEAALAPFRRAMTKAEQLSVAVEVVWIARWLGMERKEASATREVAKLLAMAVVEGREESRRLASQASRQAAAAGDASVGLGLGMGVASQAVAVRRKEVSDGNTGVMSLFERICTVFGVDLMALESDSKRVIVLGKEAEEPRFGWADLQVEIMKEGIAVAEALPDHVSVIRMCLSALQSLHTHLSGSNQSHLAKLYPAAISTIRRRGIEFGGTPWWVPGRVVLSMEIAGLPANKIPFEHARSELPAAAAAVAGCKDPFLYNPRLKVQEAGKTVLVANEQVDVFVTLQNVFNFDLEIQDLSLLTSGAPFVTTPLPLILPASSVQTVRVTGLAPSLGALKVKGVHLRLMDGSSAEFLLPVVDAAEQQQENSRRARQLADAAKTKRSGLDARKSVVVAPAGDVPTYDQGAKHRWLECQVVEEQPLLWINKTSLTHGTVMLYNGETSTIRITLENSSNVPVDFVKLSFDDSVSREAQALLSEGEISPDRAYEIEWDAVQRPVFSWDNETDISIPAGGRTTITVKCLGKVGCTDATISIDYGYIRRAESKETDAFHTRRLTFPVLFTVYHTLEAYALDLVDLRQCSGSKENARQRLTNGTPRSGTFSVSSDEELRRALAQNDDNNVLFCINVRNVYSVPFEVALSTKVGKGAKTDGALVVTRLVPPGATERMVLPIERQSLTEEERSRAIPSLSGRQYVVAKEQRTPSETARIRELFWFRERLLSMVEVSWREPSSLRFGNLSLRDQSLNPAQLTSFRLDELAVELSVKPRKDGVVAPMDFIDLTVTVTNNLDRTLRPFVRLEALPTSSTDASWSVPAPPAPPRRFSSLPAAPQPVPRAIAFDGILAATLPTLAPGESASHVVGAALLASGAYTFRAAAEEVVVPAPVSPPNITFSPSVTVDAVE